MRKNLEKIIDANSFFIFCSAFIIRLIYICLNTLGEGELTNDAAGYQALALNLLKYGNLMLDNGWRAHRMPGYPIFLSSIYFFFSGNIFAVQLTQAILNSLSCVLLYRAAKHILPFNFALTAGVVSCFYFDMFAGTSRILSETLYIFFVCSFLSVWFKETDQKRDILFLGSLAGLAAMVRPEGALWGIFAGLTLFFNKGKRSLFFFITFFPLLGIWGTRNYFIFDRIVLSTTYTGASTYYGIQRPLVEMGKAPKESLFLNLADQDEIESDEFFKKKAAQTYREISLKKLMGIWLYGLGVLLYPFRPAYDITLVLALPFWLLGLYAAVRKPTDSPRGLAIYVAGSLILYSILGGVAARYRQPIAPGIILLSCFGLLKLHEITTKRIFGFIVGSWIFLSISVWPGMALARELLGKLKNILSA